MSRKVLGFIFAVFLFAPATYAQSAEVTIQLNEKFFDTVLDAVFNNSKPLEFPIGANLPKSPNVSKNTFANSYAANRKNGCEEKITVMRELGGVRTAVQFRDGKIIAPIAFTGTYNPPFIGCIDFQGWAETNIELEFDRNRQTLFGRAQVKNVQLGSVANLAGGLIAKFVQNTIDKKINPIQILKTDKLDFIVPIEQTNRSLRLKANNLRYDVGENVLNIYVNLEFSKAD